VDCGELFNDYMREYERFMANEFKEKKEKKFQRREMNDDRRNTRNHYY